MSAIACIRARTCGIALLAACVLAGGERPALGQPRTAPDGPRRIVTLIPSLTETVCALGACGRIVGTDRYSNWPPSVRTLPKLGGIDDTEVERVAALHPDLVLTAESTRAADRLRSVGLNVLAIEPQSWSETKQAIAAVARALGEPAAGAALVGRIDARVAAAAARVPARWRGATVYFEVAPNPYAASPASFVGELLVRMRLVNVVPAALGTFPQLNPEFVLHAQPELIMASRSELATMPQRPGWSGLLALQRHRVCGFDPPVFDTMVRPGPRLGEAAEAIADCLQRLGTIRP
jgi:cobalamin transport system substrate-binding protein